MKKSLKLFITSVEDKKFFEAHEYLEEIWFPKRFESSVEIFMLKGFINAAVSFELYKRQRERQSDKVWKNYLKYRQLVFKLSTPYQNEFY